MADDATLPPRSREPSPAPPHLSPLSPPQPPPPSSPPPPPPSSSPPPLPAATTNDEDEAVVTRSMPSMKTNSVQEQTNMIPPCPEDIPTSPTVTASPDYQPDLGDDQAELENSNQERNDADAPTSSPPPPPPTNSPPPPPPPLSPPNPLSTDYMNESDRQSFSSQDATSNNASQMTESAGYSSQVYTSEQEEDAPTLERKPSLGGMYSGMTPSSTEQKKPAGSLNSTSQALRREITEREIMAEDFSPSIAPVDRPRFYLGDINSYTIIGKVGSGTYGEVFKCQHKVTKDIVALKKLRLDIEKNGFPLTSIREMKILRVLKHPNIVGIKELVSSPVSVPRDGKKPSLYIACEYMEHDLSGLLTHPKVRFSRTQIQCYMRQLLCGVAFMHRHKIVHRDIKASNLLLNNQGMLKVADFGLSRFWNEVAAKAGRYTNKVVTLWYRPPELLLGSTSYDLSVDIWSIGCIFAELLTGKPILQGKNEMEQLQLIFGLCGKPTEENWPGLSKLPHAANLSVDDKYVYKLKDRFQGLPPLAVDLLERLLTLDPEKRISAAEAMNHDYFWRVPTCKPRDLPKFAVASRHEYQSKKRYQEDMAAKASDGQRNVRQRSYRDQPRGRQYDRSRERSKGSHRHRESGYDNRPNGRDRYQGGR